MSGSCQTKNPAHIGVMSFDYVQFIPCMDFRSQDIDAPGIYEVSPEAYGQFLCEALDSWYNDGHPTISVRFFDNMLSVYMRKDAELCIHRKEYPKTLILELNGDSFPCDFYIHPEWKLGNKLYAGLCLCT